LKVLVADRLDAAAVERMRAAGIEVVERTGLQGATLGEALQGCRAIVIRGATRVTGEVLRAAPSLKVVVRAGTGLDNVDLGEARRHAVAVFNTPGANAVSVAELTMAMMLALERHIPQAAADLAHGRWEKAKYTGRELSGQRLGLIGFGRVGREVAKRALAFEMEVWASDPLLTHWPQGFESVRRAILEQMLPEVDVLSIHVPMSPDTRGLLGPNQISLLRPSAVLVNCSRGGIVDEPALLQALLDKRLRGAALDVFATEPPGEHPLLKLPNVIATPHLGASTAEAQRRAGLEAADIVIEALSSAPK